MAVAAASGEVYCPPPLFLDLRTDHVGHRAVRPSKPTVTACQLDHIQVATWSARACTFPDRLVARQRRR